MGILNERAEAAHTALHEAQTAAGKAKDMVEGARRAWDVAARNGYKTAEMRRADHEAALAEQVVAERALAAAVAVAQAADLALKVVRDQARARRQEQLVAHVAASGLGRADLRLVLDGADSRHYTVRVTLLELDGDGAVVRKTGRDWTGAEFSYDVERFGFDATVYGPALDWSAYDRTTGAPLGLYKPATINWGTLGTLPVAAAQDMIALHQSAVVVAQGMEEACPLWRAEDDGE